MYRPLLCLFLCAGLVACGQAGAPADVLAEAPAGAPVDDSADVAGYTPDAVGNDPDAGGDATADVRADARSLNPALQNLPANTWVRFHTAEDRSWRPQSHAGVVYDSRRGTIVMFGSDTHKRNWDNSVRVFDPFAGRWREHYPQASPDSYRLDGRGRAVAGPPEAPQPWAMHTFDAMVYDPVHDQLVVSSTPGHQQGKLKQFTDPKADVRVTWLYDLAGRRWSFLPNAGQRAPVTFAGALAYDQRRDTIFLYARRRFAELGPGREQWIEGKAPRIAGIHFMLEYDSLHHRILCFGDYKGSDKIWAYAPGEAPGRPGKWQQLHPSGDPLPADEHYPLAYDKHQGLFLLVPDGPSGAETFVFDYGENRLTRLPGAMLPRKLHMNYRMVYDPFHRVFLLVTGGGKETTAVWALSLVPPGGAQSISPLNTSSR